MYSGFSLSQNGVAVMLFIQLEGFSLGVTDVATQIVYEKGIGVVAHDLLSANATK